MGDSLRDALPPVYGPIVPAFFDKPKLEETRATCDQCAMCDHGQSALVPMEYFRADTKCCTYFPQLPNYLVGAILSDASPEMEEGKRRLRRIIASRIGVTPHGVGPPRKTVLIIRSYAEAFGRTEKLRCPYFNLEDPKASCTIWRHRESVCLTYYCKYSAGQRGFEVWRALKEYLSLVQVALAGYSAEVVGPKRPRPGRPPRESVVEPVYGPHLNAEDIDDLPPKESEYARWWGAWVGHEEEFYIACYEWVRSIKREDFAKNVGEKIASTLDVLKTKYEILEKNLLPERLVRNGRMREEHVGDKVVVTTYHRYDSFALDKDLYDVVGELRASETLQENLTRLANAGIELQSELIDYLVMAGILVEPNASTTKPLDTADASAIESRRASLEAVMRARSIPIDDATKQKIDDAEPSTLDALITRAATASSSAEVFG